jgi:hypothetical protein
MMTEAAQEATPKRKRKPKSTSLPVMKQLIDILEQRTAIMNQLRVARMTVGQLESQLQSLAQEVQWRSSVLGIADERMDIGANPPPGTPLSTPIWQGRQFDPASLTTPIFAQPPQPARSTDGVNRGMADLRSLS